MWELEYDETNYCYTIKSCGIPIIHNIKRIDIDIVEVEELIEFANEHRNRLNDW